MDDGTNEHFVLKVDVLVAGNMGKHKALNALDTSVCVVLACVKTHSASTSDDFFGGQWGRRVTDLSTDVITRR